MTVREVRPPGDQILLACDDDGRFTGQYVRRDVAHSGDGHRHLAIAVLVANREGQLLLQRRKHEVFDDVWDISGATHPLWLGDGAHESLEDAAHRCLRDEYDVRDAELQEIGAFSYFARDPDGVRCEREHCTLFVGQIGGEVTLNPEVGYAYAWVERADLLDDVAAAPDRFSPWALLSVELLQREGFFE